ncbi:hypothetical protein HYH03_000696 [Edaphochlamys debaryana]|uniref:Uncharacterized protein n=1 Tax=Edaphochlamys debaryana TaxID=47281 RepID=A0A836C6S6_9CHLO|nr:hypothetical protein HYH03_000696 [Edaphochlamys debaryana]|eukprot:KAG2502210.1 hypothetical protein HYH03_000696 [Edaphochlamys debaryana]
MPEIEAEAALRALLLSRSPPASVARELWSCNGGTYEAYRTCLLGRKQRAAAAPARAAAEDGAARASRAAAAPNSLPATVKYSFEGVKHVLAEATAAVTVLAFASLRNDLLAFGCSDGELWVVALPPDASANAPPACTKARRMHAQAVSALDWSFNNDQLLSAGCDGSLCVWDASDPAAVDCIRSISVPTTAFLCARFNKVNFSLAMVGTSAGGLDVYNCSTGMLHSRYQVTAAHSGVQVTALDSSNHHLFLGDSAACLHMYTAELHGRQLARLRPASRLRLCPGAAPLPAVSTLQFVPFCRATDSPVLLAALQDGALCIVKANEARHTAELHLRRHVPPPGSAAPSASGPSFSVAASAASVASAGAPSASSSAAAAASLQVLRLLRPSVCPLSVIHDVPLITYGSDDTCVYIVDVSARSYSAGLGRAGAVAAAATGGAAAAAADRPMTVTVLKAHRAPVTSVSWSFDEALLASADADGAVVVWQRCRLF